MDATLRGIPLTEISVRSALKSICSVAIKDDISFEVKAITPIRQDDVYSGYRISLVAVFDTIITPLSIDITTGDAITPGAVRYQFVEMFNEAKQFELWAYNIETILAEKVETILRRGVFNTRPRDYYDVFILSNTQEYDPVLFVNALQATAKHRGTGEQIKDVAGIMETIEKSTQLHEIWEKYRKQFAYAGEVTWEAVMLALRKLTDLL